MANETLSPSQAQSIIEQASSVMSVTNNAIVAKNEEFIDKLSHIWEDENAVTYVGKHKVNFDQLLQELQKNTQTFADTVKDIADGYARVAGNSVSINAVLGKSVGVVDVAKISNFFADGEGGDEFGFRNPESGASQVMDAFDALKTQVTAIASEAVERIQSINAFGNQTVIANLAKSAGKVVQIVEDHINEASQQISQYVEQTAQSYIKLGTSAETAANLSSN